ncbi:MAG: hypothetical protein KUG81_03925 [Gammaproteobacteria bacterium]|nr:hypothetical protein [Gammaproteobacteria bacterium]
MNNTISSKFNEMVGKHLDIQTITKTHKGPVRVIEPGMMCTMDFVPNRLNVHVDEQNVVNGFKFG